MPPPRWADSANEDFSLFDGRDSLFKALARESVHYGEYGCGESTVWVLRHTNADVVSVDTSLAWLGNVKTASLSAHPRACLVHVDLGQLSDWGRPVTYQHRARIADYLAGPWTHAAAPFDLVLIDGRFRVASFLFTLLQALPGTRIVFDDYADRHQYHVVEEFCAVHERYGRQALFLVPPTLVREPIGEELKRFSYVMD